jgi:glucosamine-6-phosphate deaminase
MPKWFNPSSGLLCFRLAKSLDGTRADNARFFASPDEVSMHCDTQGLGTILRAWAKLQRC